MRAGSSQDVKQPLSAVIFTLAVLLQGQRGRLSSRAALDHLGAMEEAEVEAPVAARGGPGGHGQPSDPQSTTTTNLLASVKEQVGDHQQQPSHL